MNPESIRSIVNHMNQDHSDTLLLYIHAFTEHQSAVRAIMHNIDSCGMDIIWSGRTAESADDKVAMNEEKKSVRLEFDEPIEQADDARRILIQMARRARQVLATRSN